MIEEIKDRILAEMQARDINYTEFAKLCGLTLATVSKFFGDKNRGINLLSFIKICKALKVSADYLIYGEKK
jgi:DNA-binding Xre family transcriptional regulator